MLGPALPPRAADRSGRGRSSRCPSLFYAAHPLLSHRRRASSLSLTDWNIVGPRRFVGLDNYRRLFADPIVLEGHGQHLPVPGRRRRREPRRCPFSWPTTSTGSASATRSSAPSTSCPTSRPRWPWPGSGGGSTSRCRSACSTASWCGPGLPQQPFLRSTEQALYAVLAPAIWAGLGFQIVIFLAGLKAIPQEYYEAAAIDGAGAWRSLVARHAAAPPAHPRVPGRRQLDRLPAHLRLRLQHDRGQGGPLDATKPLVLMIYETAFGHFQMGYATAQTVVLFAILLADLAAPAPPAPVRMSPQAATGRRPSSQTRPIDSRGARVAR